MAKKIRRVRRSSSVRQPTVDEQEASAITASSLADNAGTRNLNEDVPAKNKQRNKNKLTSEEELRQDYAYVLLDLRRIAILAAVMFALLILLNLLLQ